MSRRLILVSACLAVLCFGSLAHATVLRGTIVGQYESYPPFHWGDALHDLYQSWSVAEFDSGAWFYGHLHTSDSNVDVYNAGLVDPTTVTHAELFPYTTSYVHAFEGDTVFFRSVQGYYGAWRIDNVYKVNNFWPYSKLDGEWFFQSDGIGDFTVPEPACAGLLSAIAAILTSRCREKLVPSTR